MYGLTGSWSVGKVGKPFGWCLGVQMWSWKGVYWDVWWRADHQLVTTADGYGPGGVLNYRLHLMCCPSSWTVRPLKTALRSSIKCQEPLAQHVTSLKLFMHLDMLLNLELSQLLRITAYSLHCFMVTLYEMRWTPHHSWNCQNTVRSVSSMQPTILAHNHTRLYCFHLSTNKMHLQYVIQ